MKAFGADAGDNSSASLPLFPAAATVRTPWAYAASTAALTAALFSTPEFRSIGFSELHDPKVQWEFTYAHVDNGFGRTAWRVRCVFYCPIEAV